MCNADPIEEGAAKSTDHINNADFYQTRIPVGSGGGQLFRSSCGNNYTFSHSIASSDPDWPRCCAHFCVIWCTLEGRVRSPVTRWTNCLLLFGAGRLWERHGGFFVAQHFHSKWKRALVCRPGFVRKIRIVLSSHDNRLLLRIRTGWLALRLTGQQSAPNAPHAAIPSPNDGGSSVSSRVCRVILSPNWGCTAGSGGSGSRAKQQCH
ncbi:unnamed protein product [Protopolystoma xenopodis]|uniref:Uncharacterized protein n=1 Tax=Protopolystoma xenopodis TaxID=117903 RepID=A0A3S5B987_9PLAT|nr:unnamed protein product [Protopolystoma xenopodis]